MKIIIYGANLLDQSKGQFVVHAEGCKDCAKLDKRDVRMGAGRTVLDLNSELEVSAWIWSDFIKEGSMTAEEGLIEMHFFPCVKFPAQPTVPTDAKPIETAVRAAFGLTDEACRSAFYQLLGALGAMEELDKLTAKDIAEAIKRSIQ